ncbi:LLM class flavin-dependent oxidoreductase [Pseudonocardia spinosispora]|uniref:LLM class flavin-dependent oxidoreductase n=1 Tax=Pseudonocardia spinosispora TaxID=103441 RepID=UPI0004018C9D|nr:LLM class flavin-dependent oxidoreductase [Pseudonocardia spinosispora]
MSYLSDVALSVLDTSPIVQGSTARTALLNTLDLARLADRLGYHRYWVPEHHSMRGVASAAPAVLVGQLAAETERIRVGSGGVLLFNHAPIVVAEQFGTLEAFHPGRIDLGIGRSLGGNRRTAAVVRSDTERHATSFTEQFDALLAFLTQPEGQTIRAIPAVGNTPPVWLLGSTEFSAQLAASRGLPYAYAHHLNPESMRAALRLYREAFQPSPEYPEPTVLVSVSVIAADSDDQAQWLAGPSKLKFLERRLGKRMQLPPPQEAAAYPYTDEDHAAIEEKFADVIIGGPETVAKGLRALCDDTGATELMLTTQVYDHPDRRRSYEIIAELTR